MSIIIFFIFILGFLETDAFIKNSSSYKISRTGKIHQTPKSSFPYKKIKIYKLKKKKIRNELYSLKDSVTKFLNKVNRVRRGNVKSALIPYHHITNLKNIFKTNLTYYNNTFNRCKLDRLLVTCNVLLYLLLNKTDTKKEKQIVFSKGKIIELKNEQKCEKYKCNYKDIQKKQNYKTFFTSIFIHKNIVHLYFNMSSLISIYKLVSLMYNNIQILTVFLLSGFLSNVISYLYDSKKKKYIFLDSIINKESSGTTMHINTNKIICGCSSSIYSLYGLYITYIVFFYFKHHYIINTNFLYNFFYSFLTSLFMENVSHVNHILGFLCGSFSALFIILLDNKN